jgi:hypothetical protein
MRDQDGTVTAKLGIEDRNGVGVADLLGGEL